MQKCNNWEKKPVISNLSMSSLLKTFKNALNIKFNINKKEKHEKYS